MPERADPLGRWDSDVVLTDGTTMHLRPMRRDDDERVRELCRRLSQESLYFRFFTAMPADRADGHATRDFGPSHPSSRSQSARTLTA